MASKCAALSTPNTMWSFCPSLPASIVLTVLFALTTLAHLFQAVWHKKPYCWVIVASGTAQTLAYIFRDLSIVQVASFGPYAAWFILILVAPLFTNAFVYMVMGRMIWNFTPEAKVNKVTAWRMGTYFIVLDLCALVVQIYGAASASSSDVAESKVLLGLHIYMIGVGIQQAFIFLFLFFAISFHRMVLHNAHHTNEKPTQALTLLYTIYVVLGLITLRIIFRLAEYSQGLTSNIPNHEVYQYCLDSLPMLIALVILNAVHPGRVMPGKECDIPGRKQRKAGRISKRIDHPDVESIEAEAKVGV